MSRSRSSLADAPFGPTLLMAGAFILIVAACSSDKEPAKENPQGIAAPSAPAAPAGGVVSKSGNDDVSKWFEEEEPEAAAPVIAATSSDPNTVIERYQRECGSGAKTADCKALRMQVEAIFLESVLVVRASNQRADPRWYRVAAASETSQLACIGVTEVIWDPKRTADDDALIARALESPYHAVRGAVVRNFGKVPGLADTWKRNGGFDYAELTGVCVDEGKDPVPGLKWAGNYPGARFRPFASNESRRWFTTPDAPEKVIAWFAARGLPARTEQQMAMDAQAKYMEEMTRLSSDPNVDNTDKMMQVMMNQATYGQWSAPFRNMEGIGEARYVMIAPGQAIAIFRDEVYQATSIVAHEPQPPVTVTAADVEKTRWQEEMRQIFAN